MHALFCSFYESLTKKLVRNYMRKDCKLVPADTFLSIIPPSSLAQKANLCGSHQWDCRSPGFGLGFGPGSPSGCWQEGVVRVKNWFLCRLPVPFPGWSPWSVVFTFSQGDPSMTLFIHVRGNYIVLAPLGPAAVTMLLLASKNQAAVWFLRT